MTISFAGIPSRNAIRVTPESPMHAPSGSKRVAMPYRSVCPFTMIFWQSQITAPAGMATVTALASTKIVLSSILRTITSPQLRAAIRRQLQNKGGRHTAQYGFAQQKGSQQRNTDGKHNQKEHEAACGNRISLRRRSPKEESASENAHCRERSSS